MIDVKVEMKREDFMWQESRDATRKFFEIEKNYKEIFCKENLENILNFYADDVFITLYELIAIVQKNENSLVNKNNADLKISMFAEGAKGCHKLIFYLSDYNAKDKGQMAFKHAKNNFEHVFFKREEKTNLKKVV